jgi:hypothetical protein
VQVPICDVIGFAKVILMTTEIEPARVSEARKTLRNYGIKTLVGTLSSILWIFPMAFVGEAGADLLVLAMVFMMLLHVGGAIAWIVKNEPRKAKLLLKAYADVQATKLLEEANDELGVSQKSAVEPDDSRWSAVLTLLDQIDAVEDKQVRELASELKNRVHDWFCQMDQLEQAMEADQALEGDDESEHHRRLQSLHDDIDGRVTQLIDALRALHVEVTVNHVGTEAISDVETLLAQLDGEVELQALARPRRDETTDERRRKAGMKRQLDR